MADKIDDKALTDAINKTENEIASLKSKSKPKNKDDIDKKVTETKTIKRGDKTKKITVTKKVFKKPEDFNTHPLTNSIDNIMDKIIGEDGASKDCQFGASCVLTLDYYLSNVPDHPLLFLGISGGMVAIKTLSNRGMMPKLFKKDEKIPAPKETETIVAPKVSEKMVIRLKEDESVKALEDKMKK